MRTGDFTGSTQFGDPYSIVHTIDSTRTRADPFQCDRRCYPAPVAPDGTQPTGTALQHDPGRSDQSHHAADDQFLSRCQTRSGAGFNFANVPVRKLDEGNSTSAWTTISPARTRSSRASATIRRPISSRRFRRICGTQSFCQHPEHHQPWPQRSAFGNPHLLRRTRSISSVSASTAFSTTFCRSVTAPASRQTRHSWRQSR